MTYGALDVVTYNEVTSVIGKDSDSPRRQEPHIHVEVAPPMIEERARKLSSSAISREQLIEAVTLILEDLIRAKYSNYKHESEIPTKTVFHARTIPSISIKEYLTRFSQYTRCQDDVLIYTLVYFDRIGERFADFCVDSFNVHKLLLISLSVASKFCDDCYCTNTYYANVGGISVEEFNKIESVFLVDYIQFNMHVKPETYEMYYTDVTSYYENVMLQKRRNY